MSVNAKFERELRLSGWAAQHRDEFGNRGKGPRATMRLNAAELTAFNAEYEELIARYSLRRRSSSDGRDVAIRFYAFPNPTEATFVLRGRLIARHVAARPVATITEGATPLIVPRRVITP